MNKLLASIVLFGLIVSANADTGSASDNDNLTAESVFASIGDLVLVRPLGAAATVGGFGLFAVTSPFAAMADATEDIYDTLVEKPGNYTFNRDLGDFSK